MKNPLKLKEFRTVYGLTQAQAGESIGIDQRQWQRYESGVNEMPLHYIVALCLTHKIDANWLLGLKEE